MTGMARVATAPPSIVPKLW